MKIDPCTCSADKRCVDCRHVDELFAQAEREALLELGRATFAAVQLHRIRDNDPHEPGE